MATERSSQRTASGRQRQPKLCIPCCGPGRTTSGRLSPSTRGLDPIEESSTTTRQGSQNPSARRVSRPSSSLPRGQAKSDASSSQDVSSARLRGRGSIVSEPPSSERSASASIEKFWQTSPLSTAESGRSQSGALIPSESRQTSGSKRESSALDEDRPFIKAWKTHIEKLTPEELKLISNFQSGWSMKELLTQLQWEYEQQSTSTYRQGLKLAEDLTHLLGPVPDMVGAFAGGVQPVAIALGIVKAVMELAVGHLVNAARISEAYSMRQDVPQQIYEALVELYGTFLDFFQEAMPAYKSDTGSARKKICFIWRDYDNRFGDIVKSIETLSKNLEGAERFAMIVGVSDIQYQGYLEVLGDLNMEEYRRTFDYRVDGTCSWISEEDNFNAWLRHPSQVFLTILGNAGTGKTIMMDYIAEILQNAQTFAAMEILVCSFFFAENMPNQNTPLSAIRCLICQLLRQNRLFASLFKASLDEYEGPTSLYHSLPGLCSTLSQMIQHISGKQVGVVIVVDSLHECDKDSVKELLRQFRDIASQCANVKFAVSSQPQPHVVSWLPDSRVSVDLHTKTRGDIEMITKSRLGELAEMYKYDQSTLHKVQKAIISKANTCFQWVDLIIKDLESTFSNNADVLLQQVNKVPQELAQVYRQKLSNIAEPNEQIAVQTLTALMVARRELTLKELAVIAVIDFRHCKPRDIEAVFELNRTRNILGPLIRLEKGRVRLSHPSLREYLGGLFLRSAPLSPVDAGRENSMERKLTRSATHDAIATACILCLFWSYLDEGFMSASANKPLLRVSSSAKEDSSSSKDNRPKPLTQHSSQNLDSISPRSESCVEAFFSYASRYWSHHYSTTSASVSKSLQPHVMFLIGQRHFSKDEMAQEVLPKWTEEYQKHQPTSRTSKFPAGKALNPFVLAAYFDLTSKLEAPLRKHLAGSTNTLNDACKWAAKKGSTKALKDILRWSESHNQKSARSARDQMPISSGGGKRPIPENDWVGILVNLLPSSEDYESHHGVMRTDPHFLETRKSKVEMFKFVVRDYGSKITRRDELGRTILSHIAERGDIEMLQVLLELAPRQELNLLLGDKGDKGKLTPLCWALNPSQQPGCPRDVIAIVKAFCKEPSAGAQLDSRDALGRTPLALASHRGLFDAVSEIVTRKPEIIDRQDNAGRSPLSLAAEHERGAKVASILIRTGKVNVESSCKQGFTPLRYAMQNANLKLVKVLVSEGHADLRKMIGQDPNGNSRLLVEVSKGSQKLLGLISGLHIGSTGRPPSVLPKDSSSTSLWSSRYAASGRSRDLSEAMSSSPVSSSTDPSFSRPGSSTSQSLDPAMSKLPRLQTPRQREHDDRSPSSVSSQPRDGSFTSQENTPWARSSDWLSRTLSNASSKASDRIPAGQSWTNLQALEGAALPARVSGPQSGRHGGARRSEFEYKRFLSRKSGNPDHPGRISESGGEADPSLSERSIESLSRASSTPVRSEHSRSSSPKKGTPQTGTKKK